MCIYFVSSFLDILVWLVSYHYSENILYQHWWSKYLNTGKKTQIYKTSFEGDHVRLMHWFSVIILICSVYPFGISYSTTLLSSRGFSRPVHSRWTMAGGPQTQACVSAYSPGSCCCGGRSALLPAAAHACRVCVQNKGRAGMWLQRDRTQTVWAEPLDLAILPSVWAAQSLFDSPLPPLFLLYLLLSWPSVASMKNTEGNKPT